MFGINGVPPNLEVLTSNITESTTDNSGNYPTETTPVASETWRTFDASAYVAMCDTGCTGFTKTEIDVRHTIYHRELRVVAVDPKVIPLWSTLEIRLADGTMFKAIAVDTGGLIKGRKIDVLVAREKDAWDFGRQGVKVQLIDNEETIR